MKKEEIKVTCAYELREVLNEKYGTRLDTDEFLSTIEDMVIGKLDEKTVSIVYYSNSKLSSFMSVLVEDSLENEKIKELILTLREIIKKSPIFSCKLKDKNLSSTYYYLEWDLENSEQRINFLKEGKIYPLYRVSDIKVYEKNN